MVKWGSVGRMGGLVRCSHTPRAVHLYPQSLVDESEWK